ncbi:PEP-CTERM sorting domain-containing protein [Alkalimarinus coralli]|uniref:PEP-CTERM sorting domain-containing protein n=1 Tax=Alkalimarinus coralli TaxID=2935863 RepID=UPI00202B1584|nr:PEP-CTERM sorting domain-containing protein [Alkalimarinus coralli]
MKYFFFVLVLFSSQANALLIQFESEAGESFSGSFSVDTISPKKVEGSEEWGVTNYVAGEITNFSTTFSPIKYKKLTESYVNFYQATHVSWELVIVLRFDDFIVSAMSTAGGFVPFNSPDPLADFLSRPASLVWWYKENRNDPSLPISGDSNFKVSATIPEPGSLSLLSLGLLGFAAKRRFY